MIWLGGEGSEMGWAGRNSRSFPLVEFRSPPSTGSPNVAVC